VDRVVQAWANLSFVFANTKPYQQKEPIRLVLNEAIMGPDYVKMSLDLARSSLQAIPGTYLWIPFVCRLQYSTPKALMLCFP